MNLYRFQTVVTHKPESKRTPSHFADWYECETEAQARELYAEDMHRCGLPESGITTIVTQMNPETLKPI